MKNHLLSQFLSLGSIAIGQMFVNCASSSQAGKMRDPVAVIPKEESVPAVAKNTPDSSKGNSPDRTPSTTNPPQVAAKKIQIEYKYQMKLMITYSLALRPNNQMSPGIMKNIAKLDENYRRCYSTELEKDPDFRGTVEFLVSKQRGSGSLDINSPESNMASPVMIQCLSAELGKIRLSPEILQEQAQGKIIYTFDNFVTAANQTVAAQ